MGSGRIVAPSSVALRTRARGLLSRLAHDLEIASEAVEGEATIDGESWTARLAVPSASLRVKGVLHGDVVDPGVLSAGDRAEIERRLREEVLGGARAVTVEAAGASRSGGEATVVLAGGRERVRVGLRVVEEAGVYTVSATARVSLARLGVREVKGPLGAFRVDDVIEVIGRVTVRAD
jgi:hypothetical protein